MITSNVWQLATQSKIRTKMKRKQQTAVCGNSKSKRKQQKWIKQIPNGKRPKTNLNEECANKNPFKKKKKEKKEETTAKKDGTIYFKMENESSWSAKMIAKQIQCSYKLWMWFECINLSKLLKYIHGLYHNAGGGGPGVVQNVSKILSIYLCFGRFLLHSMHQWSKSHVHSSSLKWRTV